jgi:uncharacterized protein YdhG (YjbR/CyaY superfamily)
MNTSFTTIDQYIAAFPASTQKILEEMRALIHAAAPTAAEKIAYQMPTFYLNGNLVHFGAHEHHIGFYPTPSGIEAFAGELSQYKTSKGAIQFPIDQPMPRQLIQKIVKFRVEENLAKGKKK